MFRGIGSTDLWKITVPMRGYGGCRPRLNSFAALRPAFWVDKFARDRNGPDEPCVTALSFGRGSRSTIDLVGCQRTKACGGVHRVVGGDDEAGASRTAPQAWRNDLPDRRNEHTVEPAQRELGAVLDRGVRGQGARDL